MISRVFTVDKVATGGTMECYKGFDRNYGIPATIVALVQEEDTVEVYCLDEGEKPLLEFGRYMENEDEAWREFLGFYRKI